MSDPGSRTYYDILQVHPKASRTVIRSAYRALLKNAHPDVGGTPAETQALNEAYAVLMDPARRRAYDEELAYDGAGSALPVVHTRYVLICPACRQRNVVADPHALHHSKCAACGHVLLPPRRMPVETDHGKAFRLGVFMFDKGLLPRARREFEAAVRLQPRSAKYHYWLGRCQYGMRTMEQSRQSFQVAARLHPRKFHFHFWLGQTHYALRDYGQALASFVTALKLRSDHAPTRLRVASCYFHLGYLDKAINVLEAAIRREPTRLDLYTLLGVVYLASRNPSAALQAFQRADRLHPGDSTARKYIDFIKRR